MTINRVSEFFRVNRPPTKTFIHFYGWVITCPKCKANQDALNSFVAKNGPLKLSITDKGIECSDDFESLAKALPFPPEHDCEVTPEG